MKSDPKGYYSTLGIHQAAAPSDVISAFRRKARQLHPDVPGTGDAGAFVALKAAYDVLSDPDRRAAYDRSAEQPDELESEEIIAPHPAPPAPAPLRTRQPRLSDLPIALWAVMGGVAILASIQVARNLAVDTTAVRQPAIPAKAPRVEAGAPTQATAVLAPATLPGNANFFVIPSSGPAILWERDGTGDKFRPAGQLPPFSAVQGLRFIRDLGLVEVRVTESRTGFIDASRVTPGNAAAAHRAYCAYNAGPPPDNAEVLDRRGTGPGEVLIENRSTQPAVVKLRNPAGIAAATVFLAPGGKAQLNGLPREPYRAQFALGEMWSRTCHSFAAGMRAQQFAAYAGLDELTPLAVPPDLAAPVQAFDIPDQVFERDQ
jgi:hypothetical protein